MRRKRLLCVCLVLALLLTVPARAGEAPELGETPPASEETVPETPETSETPESPEIPGTGEEPDGPEDPEDSEEPKNPEDPEPEAPENPDPETPENPEDPEDPESPETPGDEEPAEGEEPGGDEEPAEDEEPEEEDEPAAAMEEPVIYVEVPDTGHVVVNPYGLEVNLSGISSRDQIVSAPMPIVSYSNVPIAVLASATGYAPPGSEAVFVSAPPQDGSKELFLFAEFQNAYDEYGGAIWTGVYTGAENQLPVTAWGAAPREVLRLDAADGMTPVCGAFRLFGSASLPTEGMWRAQDAVRVSLTFTFIPTFS